MAPFEVCTAPTGFQVRKNVSGVMPIENAGRSAIHSALSFWQVVHDCTVEKLFAGLLKSVSDSVYEVRTASPKRQSRHRAAPWSRP